MSITSGFMCYIQGNDVIHGTICSQYVNNAWYSDLHNRNIQLEFDIANNVSMRYLAFAITANNYEWEVLHVQDKENNIIADVIIPEKYDSTFKLGIKLYNTPPTVGSVLNVGFDYVINGGINLSEVSPELRIISMSCPTDGATIRYTLDDSEPLENSTEYIEAIEVEIPITVKARGFKNDMQSSEIGILFLENLLRCATPTYEIKDGKLYLYCSTDEAEIYYNVNAVDEPTYNDILYGSPITIDDNVTMLIKAVSKKHNCLSSGILSVDLIGTVITPEITFEANKIYVTCETPYAEIYYTTDGTDPKTSATVQKLTGEYIRIWEDTYVRVYAERDNYNDSSEITYNAVYDWSIDYSKLGYENDTIGYDGDEIGFLEAIDGD